MEKLNAQQERGRKWKLSKENVEYRLSISQAKPEDVEWFSTEKNVVEDIKAYEDFLKPEEKPKEKSKSNSKEK